MKKFLSLRTTLLGLGCASALNVFAFTPLPLASAGLGNLPLYFEAGSDSTAGPVQFVTRGCNYQFLLSPTEVQIALGKTGVKPAEVRMNFAGANPGAQMSGDAELPGKINYLIGNNPTRWHTGVATFARVRVKQLYPGIGLVYYGNQRQLEYDFTVAPGANPDAIRIHFDGVDKISIGPREELILAVEGSEIRQPAPVIYQTLHGQRQAINGRYRLVDAHTVAFAVGKYDQKLPLVIDPILGFATYFGGNSIDLASSVALDTNGFVYIAGQTISSHFYPTLGAFQTNFAGGGITGDAFVAKLTTNGQSLIYFTYLGGNADDAVYALAVDSAGDAYVTGFTDSKNFPVTNSIPGGVEGLSNSMNISGTVGPTGYYPGDAFVAELSPSGSNLVYSTYLGGSATDAGIGIAVDSSGNAYVTGVSYSTNFPTTPNAFQKNLMVTNWAYQAYFNANAFVTEISANGTNLLYSSYLGGTNFDQGGAIAVDLSNNVYVTGLTASTNFPTTNAVQQQFVSVMLTTNAAPTNTVLITNFFNGYLLNGTTNVDPAFDVFVTKFAPGCTSLIYSTFLGGTNNDVADGIAVDGSGNAYVTGWTVSTNFPNTATNIAGLYNGLTNNAGLFVPLITNAFLTQVTWTGSNAAIGYSAVFGGTNYGFDVGYGVAVDPSGDVFVVGSSSSTNFPAVNTPGLLGPTNAGGSDAFVIAFNTNATAILYSGYLGGSGDDFGYGIAVDALTNVYIVGQTASANFPVFNAKQSSLNGPSDAFLAKIVWAVQAPVITTQPTNQALLAGSTVTFVTAVTGTPPLFYYWQLNGTNLMNGTNAFGSTISGATNITLIINNAHTNDSGNYQFIVTNFEGSVTSSVAVLTITNSPPIITVQPTNQLYGAGATASLALTAIGTPPLSYQWQLGGVNLTNGATGNGSTISGATSANLTITSIQTNDAGNYLAIITNSFGSVTSQVAVLTVENGPVITQQPTNQIVGVGSTASFVVFGNGQPPFSLQWLKNGVDLTDGTNASGSVISGSTNSNLLKINNAQTNDDGNYWIIVTNSLGSVTSSMATLTVLTAPLFNGIASDTNGGFILTGVGGTNSGSYTVLTSTNLAIPLALWTPVATNQFGSQGEFIFTNIAPTDAPQLFYLLQMQ